MTYRQLLQYNTLWSTTDGIRFALTDDPPEVNLMLELPVAELNVQLFLTAVNNFVEKCVDWKTIIMRTLKRSRVKEATLPHDKSLGHVNRMMLRITHFDEERMKYDYIE